MTDIHRAIERAIEVWLDDGGAHEAALDVVQVIREMSTDDKAELLGETDVAHTINFTETGFVIKHLVACRPDLVSCPYTGLTVFPEDAYDGLGEYVIEIDSFGDPVIWRNND